MKKPNKMPRSTFGMEATTTSKDWGHGPVAGKGGKTHNHEIQQSIIQREMREQKHGKN